ncbi:MAG TPA: hypothetical protein VLG71_01855 [Candidatus Limnocylindria bacterium]|nr:hypothetical protein [Candidatus Limnocylindria bacterium]
MTYLSLPHHRTRSFKKLVTALFCTCMLTTSVQTYTVSFETAAKYTCAGLCGYALTVGYMATVIQDATSTYAPARHILVTTPDLKQFQCLLKQEMLRSHDYMLRTSWFDSNHRHFPLVWYKDNLDSYINSLWRMSFFGVVDRQFLDDLYAIRDAIVTDYDFIKERREYEQKYR